MFQNLAFSDSEKLFLQANLTHEVFAIELFTERTPTTKTLSEWVIGEADFALGEILDHELHSLYVLGLVKSIF